MKRPRLIEEETEATSPCHRYYVVFAAEPTFLLQPQPNRSSRCRWSCFWPAWLLGVCDHTFTFPHIAVTVCVRHRQCHVTPAKLDDPQPTKASNGIKTNIPKMQLFKKLWFQKEPNLGGKVSSHLKPNLISRSRIDSPFAVAFLGKSTDLGKKQIEVSACLGCRQPNYPKIKKN